MSNGGNMLECLKHSEPFFEEANIKILSISQYSNLRNFGRGRLAIVYSAVFQGQTLALKSFNNNLSLDEKMFRKFIQELKHYNKVDHPNIIKFYGISRETGNFMFALQLANEGNLRDHLQKKASGWCV
ncbi:8318_t:CDS:2 [Cetraspora pellucida]|uniref:8318_t:CDS:1 n=1 Tax=Cetraspora pellucida TaxID=1433469 RepID=A0ACA9LMB9_9GLOM|nr:8318_t:CDS:2 [Cetraspora pellucida]